MKKYHNFIYVDDDMVEVIEHFKMKYIPYFGCFVADRDNCTMKYYPKSNRVFFSKTKTR